MKKRKYVKPSFEVVVLNRQAQLLAGSGVTYTGTAGFGSGTEPVFEPELLN